MITGSGQIKNTTPKVVVPFYLYAAAAFLFAAFLLILSTEAFNQHYFHPKTLAITHVMALGWGTMIILGASHQLVPVLIESKLYSEKLAFASFLTAGIGIPFLIYGFYFFKLGFIAITGGVLINLAIFIYVLNLTISISKSRHENVHAVFVFTASLWLLLTTLLGLLLLINFTHIFLPSDSLHYLSLHAHMGMAGWFLLLVIGVGSRLIPMFIISKYDNKKSLWAIYYLINVALLLFIIMFFSKVEKHYFLLPVMLSLWAIIVFARFCYRAYQQRIRKKLDEQMKVSMLSVIMMALPVVMIFVILGLMIFNNTGSSLVLAYGFTIFFGWITAIIFGMTFKTLPFIIWNKVYHAKAGLGKTPNPKNLYSNSLFNYMTIAYLSGFIIFFAGLLLQINDILHAGAILLFVSALLYFINVFKLVRHKY